MSCGSVAARSMSRRFERLVAERAPREALALWRGPPLDDVAGEPFAARRSAGSRSCGSRRSSSRSRTTWPRAGTARCSASSRRWWPRSRCASGCTRSGCWRCTAAAGRPTRSTPTARRARRWWTRSASSRERSCGACTRRSCARTRRSTCPRRRRSSCRSSSTPARRWSGARPSWRGCASSGAARTAAPAGSCLSRARAGSARRGWRPSSPARCIAIAARCCYASGAGAPDAALAALRPPRRRGARRCSCSTTSTTPARRCGRARRARRRPGRAAGARAGHRRGCEQRWPAARRRGGLGAARRRRRARRRAALRRREDAEAPVERLARRQRRGPAAGAPRRGRVGARGGGAASGRVAQLARRAERTGLRATEDDLAGDVVRAAGGARARELRETDAGVVACPFKGLASFDVDDAEFFFGRERLVAEMVARAGRRTADGDRRAVGQRQVLGAARRTARRAGRRRAARQRALGARAAAPGRASAARARAGDRRDAPDEPADRRGRPVRGGSSPPAATRPSARRSSTRSSPARATRAGARSCWSPCAPTSTARCAAYPELSRLLGANHVLVGPMRRDELRRAIELPAQRAGLRVEPDLVDALIADVEGEPGALPLLSTSLLELWQQRDGRRMRLSAYEHAGGVHGAVARLAERAYERLDPDRREVARRILLRLAGEGEGDAVVRRRVPLDELHGEGVADVLAVLADDRLVTIGEGEVEVAHEALLREWPRLRGWLEEDAQGRHLHHQLSGAGARMGRRRPRPRRALPRRAAGRDARLERPARARAQRRRARVPRCEPCRAAELERAPASRQPSPARSCSPASAPAGARGRRRVPSRSTARQARASHRGRRRAAPRRRGAHERALDQALLLARAGVALDDSTATRSQPALGADAQPPALGELPGDGLDPSRRPQPRTGGSSRSAAASDTVTILDTASRRPVGRALSARRCAASGISSSRPTGGRSRSPAATPPTQTARRGRGPGRPAHARAAARIVLPSLPGAGAYARRQRAVLPDGRDVIVQQVHEPLDTTGRPRCCAGSMANRSGRGAAATRRAEHTSTGCGPPPTGDGCS